MSQGMKSLFLLLFLLVSLDFIVSPASAVGAMDLDAYDLEHTCAGLLVVANLALQAQGLRNLQGAQGSASNLIQLFLKDRLLAEELFIEPSLSPGVPVNGIIQL